MKSGIIAAGLLAAGLSAGAQAVDNNGFYGGAGAGLYYVDFDGIGFDETAPTARIFGGYQLNEYVAFEAGYSNLFEASGDVVGFDVEVDGTALDLSVRPMLPLTDQLKAFAVIGWADYDFDVSLSDGVTTVSDSESDSELQYGLGGAWRVNDAWAVRGEWIMVDVSDADFGMFSFSATYNFN
ncbi:MAG: outer membrane beta-barrel protein [Pseudomonadales bacterium]